MPKLAVLCPLHVDGIIIVGEHQPYPSTLPPFFLAWCINIVGKKKKNLYRHSSIIFYYHFSRTVSLLVQNKGPDETYSRWFPNFWTMVVRYYGWCNIFFDTDSNHIRSNRKPPRKCTAGWLSDDGPTMQYMWTFLNYWQIGKELCQYIMQWPGITMF